MANESERGAGDRRRANARRLLEPYGPTMTVPQLAEFLQQNPETIRQKAASGVLPGRRLPGGRNYFFFTDEIAELLEASLVAPADSAGLDAEAEADVTAGTDAEADAAGGPAAG